MTVLDRLRLLLRRDERLGTAVDLAAETGQLGRSAVAAAAAPESRATASAPSAEASALADHIVQWLAAQLPHALAVAILPANDRVPLAHAGLVRANSPTSMAMQFGRIAQQVSRMAAAVTPAEGPVCELILTSDQQIHVLRPCGGPEAWWLYLAVDSKDTNLAVARALMQQVLDAPETPARTTSTA